MKSPYLLIILPVLLLLAQNLHSAELESLEYRSNAELEKAWRPILKGFLNVKAEIAAMPPSLYMTGDQVKAARFNLPFKEMQGWRFAWDKKVDFDISNEEQVVLRIRADDPASIGQGSLYMQSGEGWFRFPSFGVSENWQEVVLPLNKAAKEGSPSGWDNIETIRIAFMPSAKKEVNLDLAWIKTRSGWTLDYMGAMGPYKNYPEARKAIMSLTKGIPASEDIKARISKADALYRTLSSASDLRSKHLQKKILEGRELTAEAWALVQKPKKEMRGVWIHHGDGTRSRGEERVKRWKEAIATMDSYGINAVFPNVLWSATSYYPSKVVKAHPSVAEEGDYLQEIIDAAKPLGIEVHPWKVMWQFAEGWLAPIGRSEPYRASGRLQMDHQGKVHPWLCPCDERNRKEELNALMELAEYDVDGIHLDYIRYAGRQYSYSPMCRERFEAQRGKKVAHWPADAAPGGKLEQEYHEFRKETISSFVRLVRETLKKNKPNLKLSAAVFNVSSIAENTVSQDWVKWGQEGLLDYIITMSYTQDSKQFASMVKAQKAALGANAKTTLIPGMQSTFSGHKSLPLADAVEQVLVTRAENTGGFVMFEWREFLQDSFLPYFRAGLTRKGQYDLSFRKIPTNEQAPSAKVSEKLVSKSNSYTFDTFDDGDLFSEGRGKWFSHADTNELGTIVKPSPFKLEKSNGDKPNYYARIYGHYGELRAPWPTAALQSSISADENPVDISEFNTIELDVRGDGHTYEVVLIRESVKDHSHFRQSFSATKEWQTVRLPIDKFFQPSWGLPVNKEMIDITHLRFQPIGSKGSVDFDLSIDNIRLLK